MQAQGQFLHDNKEKNPEVCSQIVSWAKKIKQPNSAECIKYHVPEQVVTKRLCSPVKA